MKAWSRARGFLASVDHFFRRENEQGSRVRRMAVLDLGPARLFAPLDYNWFLVSGHPTSPKTIASFIA